MHWEWDQLGIQHERFPSKIVEILHGRQMSLQGWEDVQAFSSLIFDESLVLAKPSAKRILSNECVFLNPSSKVVHPS